MWIRFDWSIVNTQTGAGFGLWGTDGLELAFQGPGMQETSIVQVCASGKELNLVLDAIWEALQSEEEFVDLTAPINPNEIAEILAGKGVAA